MYKTVSFLFKNWKYFVLLLVEHGAIGYSSILYSLILTYDTLVNPDLPGVMLILFSDYLLCLYKRTVTFSHALKTPNNSLIKKKNSLLSFHGCLLSEIQIYLKY